MNGELALVGQGVVKTLFQITVFILIHVFLGLVQAHI